MTLTDRIFVYGLAMFIIAVFIRNARRTHRAGLSESFFIRGKTPEQKAIQRRVLIETWGSGIFAFILSVIYGII